MKTLAPEPLNPQPWKLSKVHQNPPKSVSGANPSQFRAIPFSNLHATTRLNIIILRNMFVIFVFVHDVPNYIMFIFPLYGNIYQMFFFQIINLFQSSKVRKKCSNETRQPALEAVILDN